MNLKLRIGLLFWVFLALASPLQTGANPVSAPSMNSVPASPTPAASELDILSKAPFFDDFNSINTKAWVVQNFTWPDCDSFQKPSQVTAANSILTIQVDPAPTPVKGRNVLAGGMMTRRIFTYGRFTVRMKNQLAPGVDNCFFLMSPWRGSGWHHQELDFEFLGKDPTQVQVNVHKYIDQQGTPQNGGMLPKMIDLGFDSNKDFHVYAIDWLKDKISFYVDNKLVWTETRNLPDRGLNATVESFLVGQQTSWGPQWAGRFDLKTLPARALFDWVRYDP